MAMSAPNSPGGFNNVSASKSVATVTIAPGRVGFFDEWRKVVNRAKRIRILHQHTENFVVELKTLVIADDNFNAESFGARPDNFDVLRMATLRDEENVSSVLEPVAHRHRLGAGGGFVEQRRIGDVERGEIGDHRLEIQERFEAALGNFGLIRRVLRVPAGIFQNVALNHRRRDAIVITHADE